MDTYSTYSLSRIGLGRVWKLRRIATDGTLWHSHETFHSEDDADEALNTADEPISWISDSYTLIARNGAEVEVLHFNTFEEAKYRAQTSEFYGWTVSIGYSVEQTAGFFLVWEKILRGEELANALNEYLGA